MTMKIRRKAMPAKTDQYGVILYSKDQALDPCPLCIYSEMDIDTEPCKGCRHRIPGDAYYGAMPPEPQNSEQ